MTDDPYALLDAGIAGAVDEVAAFGRRTLTDAWFLRVDDVAYRLEGLLAQAAETLAAERIAVEREMREDRLGMVAELDRVLLLDQALVGLLHGAQGEGLPADVKYVLAGLGTRIVSVGHECGSLLRAGFPVGARARWRTLTELSVVLGVLLRGDRHTFTRYKLHRYYLAHKDYREMGMDFMTAEVRALKRRFGSSYCTQYGWAARVTERVLGVRKPNLQHLRDVAALDLTKPWIMAANHAVHADSLGLLQLVDADDVFHAGARWEGLSLAYAHTVLALQDAMSLWLEAVGKFGSRRVMRRLTDLSWSIHSAAARGAALAAQFEDGVDPTAFPFAIDRSLVDYASARIAASGTSE